MESTHLHSLQDHQPPPVADASSLSSSSGYGLGSIHSWTTPNITLNAVNYFNPNLQEAIPRSTASTQKNDDKGSMLQELGYHHQWTLNDAESCLTTNQFPKIKEEISATNFPKFTEMLSMEGYNKSLPPTASATSHTKNSEHNALISDKLLLKTLLSGDHHHLYSSTSVQNYPRMGVTPNSRGSFTQIYPSINISNLNNHSSISPQNSSSLDLLTSSAAATFGAASLSQQRNSQDHDDGVVRFTENLPFRLDDHMQQQTDCNNSTNPPHFTNGTETKRPPCSLMQPKASQSQTASKKSRLESRPSCPPLKVRKEKLGDRIAALQQLVAPFGKTDTASVLMEAIGYIKFLQSQVETLSVPYMKSSQKQTNRVMPQGVRVSLLGSATTGDTNEEPWQDLRSRGLCLVPLSCMSYIAGDGGTEVWQQPNFGGAN